VIIFSVIVYLAIGAFARGVWDYHDWHIDCVRSQGYDSRMRTYRIECSCGAKTLTFLFWPIVLIVATTRPVINKMINILGIPKRIGQVVGRRTAGSKALEPKF
jgi:hypothetical protein